MDLKEEVFETEDFDENEDVAVQNGQELESEEKDTDVIAEKTEPIKAFERFGGKIFDPSQPIGKNAEVYDATSKNDAKFESPLQKYKRLSSEINSFVNELQQVSQKASSDASDPTKEITQKLNEEISKLWSNVEEFKTNPQLASLFAEANASVLETVDASYLVKKLQQFQAQSQNNSNNNSNNNESNVATLTLYSDGNTNSQSFRAKDIEDRLTNLEKVVGPPPEHGNNSDMWRSIEFLDKRLSLLGDQSRIEGLVRKAETIRKALQDYNSKAYQSIDEQITKTKEEKIEKMFDMMTRWDQAAIQLPTVVQRLRSLKNLHEESADVVEKVQRLDTQHKLIKQTLESNEQILKQVNQSLAENAKTMSTNVQAIEDRIAKLQQAMQRSGL